MTPRVPRGPDLQQLRRERIRLGERTQDRVGRGRYALAPLPGRDPARHADLPDLRPRGSVPEGPQYSPPTAHMAAGRVRADRPQAGPAEAGGGAPPAHPHPRSSASAPAGGPEPTRQQSAGGASVRTACRGSGGLRLDDRFGRVLAESTLASFADSARAALSDPSGPGGTDRAGRADASSGAGTGPRARRARGRTDTAAGRQAEGPTADREGEVLRRLVVGRCARLGRPVPEPRGRSTTQATVPP